MHVPKGRVFRPSNLFFLLCFSCMVYNFQVFINIYYDSTVRVSTDTKIDKKMTFEYEKYETVNWTQLHINASLAVMFTTWRPSMQKAYVYENVMRNWKSLSSRVKTIVFSNDTRVTDIAKKHGWLHQPVTRTSCGGTPVLRTFFENAISNYPSYLYGYANADIVFNEGLMKTLKAVINNRDFINVPMILIGKRLDVNMSLYNDIKINDTKKVNLLAKKGLIRWGFSIDYFFTNDLFPWKLVPDIAIGRPLVDNWMSWFSRKVGVTVIDISPTVLAVHQIGKGRIIRHILCNLPIVNKIKILPLPELPLHTGAVDCAEYESRFDNDGNVIILRKTELYKMCRVDSWPEKKWWQKIF